MRVTAVDRTKDQFPPSSLLQISRELGVDRTQIARVYPDVARQVTKKRKDWNSCKARLARSIRHHAYREAAVAIANMGLLPTRNRVMNFLVDISVFSSHDREVCQKICYEVRREFRIQGRRHGF